MCALMFTSYNLFFIFIYNLMQMPDIENHDDFCKALAEFVTKTTTLKSIIFSRVC